MINFLNNHQNVVIDATNTISKYRKEYFDLIKNKVHNPENIIIKAHVIDKPLITILNQNSNRDRQVPDLSIARMFVQLYSDYPSKKEGFDEIIVTTEKEDQLKEIETDEYTLD